MYSKTKGPYKTMTFYTPQDISLSMIINKKVAQDLTTSQKAMSSALILDGIYMTTAKSTKTRKVLMFYGREGLIQTVNPNVLRLTGKTHAMQIIRECYLKKFSNDFINISKNWKESVVEDRKIPITLYDIAMVILNSYPGG